MNALLVELSWDQPMMTGKRFRGGKAHTYHRYNPGILVNHSVLEGLIQYPMACRVQQLHPLLLITAIVTTDSTV